MYKTQLLKEIHSFQCQTVVTLTRGASRYYTLPKGDLGATTVKELAPLHSRKDPVAGCSCSLTAQDHAICR